MGFFQIKNMMQLAILSATLLLATPVLSTSSQQAYRDIPSTVAIRYGAGHRVAIDSSMAIGVNNFSMAFQLDGRDISAWRTTAQLRQLAKDANFTLVRFFPQRLDEPCNSFPNNWDWSRIDDLIRKIFEIGAEPMPVLGFCGSSGFSSPSSLPKDPNTNAPYPNDFGAYCAEWVRHFKNVGLPVKYYEIVNEPHHYFGWGGSDTTRRGYFKDIFNSAARAMRAENSAIMLGNDNSMVRSNNLNKWMANNLEPIDFLSWHRYLLPISGQPTTDEFAISISENDEGVTYGYNIDNFIDRARQDYKDATGRLIPVIQSEGNLNYRYTGGTDPRIQEILNAVTSTLSMRMLILKGYVTHSVFFDFAGSEASSTRFGMVNLDDNTPWYPYYAHQMIGRNLEVGDRLVDSSSDLEDVQTLAWIHGAYLKLLLISKTHAAKELAVAGVGGTIGYYKIDESYPWNSPRMQEGSLAQGQSITLNGYAVALLSANLNA